ncbi:MAG TPA: helix-turn-helix transcriptional regulator [Streptosporangiaceae bacterium]|nr:helix-turn-helix transcriptional regulator [Streptosporangiaceae bacterium]
MAGPGRKKRADNPHAEGASRLAQRLRQLRERASKTQEEVAAAAGLSVATVRKIETGAVAEPGFFTVLAIARAIGVSVTDLADLTCQVGVGPEVYSARPGLEIESSLVPGELATNA